MPEPFQGVFRQKDDGWEFDAPAKSPSDFSKFRVRLAAPPPEPETRLFLVGKPVCTPGNLTTIIARAKTGKTAALGAAVAAIIGAHYDRTNLDTFHFTAPHTKEAVVIIDTEQSAYDAWKCHKRSLSRSGGDEDPEWLLHYAMVGLSPKALREALPHILQHAKAAHGGVFTVILDGVADFVISVNDEVGCSEFITEVRSLSITYNTPIICVIHSNEGVKSGDDGRGWLGKELTRKAESNLLLKKEGDITTITSDKQRQAPITAQDGVAFKWDNEAGRHVTCELEAPERRKGGRPSTPIAKLIRFLPEGQANAKPAPEIWRSANGATGMTAKGFGGRLLDATDEGVGVYLIDVPGRGPCFHR